MVTQTVQAVINKLMNSEMGREALEGMESDRLTRRLELVEEIRVIRAEAEVKQPELQKTIEKSESRVAKAWQTYQEALQGRAQAHRAAANNSVDRQVSRLEGELLQTADREAISAFKAEMDELGDRLRGGAYTRHQTTERRYDGNEYLIQAGNAPEVSACLAQIVATRREVSDVVVLEPLTPVELEARLEGLRQGIVLPQR